MIDQELNNGSLYNSRMDEDIIIPDKIYFQPAEPIETVIKPAPVTIKAVQTIIPQSTKIVPDLSLVPENPVIMVDEEKLSKLLDVNTGEEIISDIKNNVPLKPDITEILIKNDIVKEADPVETVPGKTVIPAPANPLKNDKANLPVKNIAVKKSGLLNSLTEFIYKIIFI